MKKSLVAFSGLVLFSMQLVAAEPLPLRPGLWEHSFTMKSESGRVEAAMTEMQRQLAGLPPAQRKMMEDMLAGQGLSMRPGGGTVQVCLTKEDIDRGALPQEEGCTHEVLEQTRERMRLRFVCEGATGEGEVVFHGPDAYIGVTTLRADIDGETETMVVNQTGKRIGDDCAK
ncbi:MAG: DUF3617 domain-containing protein [Gammaproteobacteria bacterium]|nr:DUF3617 domain-containing protein [Gammaproteobacteria bacterium]